MHVMKEQGGGRALQFKPASHQTALDFTLHIIWMQKCDLPNDLDEVVLHDVSVLNDTSGH